MRWRRRDGSRLPHSMSWTRRQSSRKSAAKRASVASETPARTYGSMTEAESGSPRGRWETRGTTQARRGPSGCRSCSRQRFRRVPASARTRTRSASRTAAAGTEVHDGDHREPGLDEGNTTDGGEICGCSWNNSDASMLWHGKLRRRQQREDGGVYTA
jgi:hypothetical protein